MDHAPIVATTDVKIVLPPPGVIREPDGALGAQCSYKLGVDPRMSFASQVSSLFEAERWHLLELELRENACIDVENESNWRPFEHSGINEWATISQGARR